MTRQTLLVFMTAALLLLSSPLVSAGAGDPCVYVANSASDYASVIDATTAVRVGDIHLDASPLAIAIDPDGRFVYAVTTGHPITPLGDEDTGTRLSVVETGAGYRVSKTIPVPSCADSIVVSPDGLFAYLGDYCRSGVDVVALASGIFLRTIPVGALYGFDPAVRFALTRDGITLYVPLPYAAFGSIGIFDTATGTRNGVITFLPDAELPEPTAVALGPGDHDAYVLLQAGNGLLPVLDTASAAMVGVFEATGEALAVAPDGSELYVANGPDLRIIDTRTKDATIVGLNTVPPGPAALALTPDGRMAFVAERASGTVVAVDTHARAVVAQIAVGERPQGLAIGNVPGGCVPAAYTLVPTYTPTPTATVTPTKVPSYECPAGEPCLQIGTVVTNPGHSGKVEVSLRTAGRILVGAQNDMYFDPRLSLHGCAGTPPFTGLALFRYEPSFRAAILHDEPITDSVLYTCEVTVSPDTPPGNYPLLLDTSFATNPRADRVPIAEADGKVVVELQSAAVSEPATAGGGCRMAPSPDTPWLWVGVILAAGVWHRRASRRAGSTAKG